VGNVYINKYIDTHKKIAKRKRWMYECTSGLSGAPCTGT